MNVHESEKLAGILDNLLYTKTDDKMSADIIIFNTCTIRENAVKRLLGNIGQLKNLKKQNRNLIIAICGCATQNKTDAELIYKKYPYVDIIFGTHNIHLLADYIKKKQEGKRVIEIWDKEEGAFCDVPIIRENSFAANVNIMYGCDNFCSYCIVPYVRGRERSRPKEDILREVKSLLSAGVKEIMLLGQNVNSYNSGDCGFSGLLEAVDEIEGKFRIKFMTSHPKDLNEKVIDVIKNSNKISKHIHLPVQSGSNNVLMGMNRKYTREKYLDLIEKIRNKIPKANISTDIIVGFPGESDEDFLDTLDLIKMVEYSSVYAFIFSKRTGTKAFGMEDTTSLDIKKKRLDSLISLQKQISTLVSKKKLGETYEVLCLKGGDGGEIALTEFNDVINLLDYREGEFIKVRVNAVKNSRLFGEII